MHGKSQMNSLGWRIVTNSRTMRALERHGFIVLPFNYGRKIRCKWASKILYAEDAGPRLERWSDVFTFRGRSFRLTYLDGCFKPFVTTLTP